MRLLLLLCVFLSYAAFGVDITTQAKTGDSSHSLSLAAEGAFGESGAREQGSQSDVSWSIKLLDSTVSMFDLITDQNINERTLMGSFGLSYQWSEQTEVGIELGELTSSPINITNFAPLEFLKFEFPLFNTAHPVKDNQKDLKQGVSVLIFSQQNRYVLRTGALSLGYSRSSGFAWSDVNSGLLLDFSLIPSLSVNVELESHRYNKSVADILTGLALDERGDAGGLHLGAEESPFEFAESAVQFALQLHLRSMELELKEKKINLGASSGSIWESEVIVGKKFSDSFYLGGSIEHAVEKESIATGLNSDAFNLIAKLSL